MRRRTVVYTDQQETGELRTVSVRTTDRGVEIVERTIGPDTQAIFGDPVHKQVLTLSDEAESTLRREAPGDSLADGLRCAFAAGELEFLSDIQDILDRAEVSYGYAAYGPGEGLYRPYFD